MGPRRNCSSECQVTKNIYSLETGETAPEPQTHTVANPRDRNGATEVKQLRCSSLHCWEGNKAINIPVSSPNSPTPTLPIQADLSRGTWDTYGSTTLCLAAATALRLHGLAQHILPWGWYPETKVTWAKRRDPPPQGIQDISTAQQRFKKPEQCERK